MTAEEIKTGRLVGWVFLITLMACREDEPAAPADLPAWLDAKIQSDERYVRQHPKSMLAYGVWVRTSWKGNPYFEYSNLLSSSLYRPISFAGDTLPIHIEDRGTGYDREKCCAEVVWHGNRIDEKYLALFHGM